MQKYRVTVASTRIYTTDIEIEAHDETEAGDLAFDIACGDIDHPDMPEGWEPDWEYSDGMGVEVINTKAITST